MANFFFVDLFFVILLITVGLYILVISRNLLRMLIGFEIMTKGVTLSIISAGYTNGKIAFSQSLTITVIVIEVVFIAVALAIIMLVHRKKQSLDVRKLSNLKG